MSWMEKNRFLLNYHNTEIDFVSSAGVREMYDPPTDGWEKNKLYV